MNEKENDPRTSFQEGAPIYARRCVALEVNKVARLIAVAGDLIYFQEIGRAHV